MAFNDWQVEAGEMLISDVRFEYLLPNVLRYYTMYSALKDTEPAELA